MEKESDRVEPHPPKTMQDMEDEWIIKKDEELMQQFLEEDDDEIEEIEFGI